jgi:ATP-dependent 26S proteasome regulatory subunit
MLTICKYESYQNEEETKGEQKDKPKANEGRAKGKQRATTKELKELKEDKEVYRAFDHLEIEQHEVDKLIQAGYSIEKIDNILDRIQNFAQNKKYKSLYLTALNWLKSDADKPTGIDKQRLQVAEGMPEHRKGLVI